MLFLVSSPYHNLLGASTVECAWIMQRHLSLAVPWILSQIEKLSSMRYWDSLIRRESDSKSRGKWRHICPWAEQRYEHIDLGLITACTVQANRTEPKFTRISLGSLKPLLPLRYVMTLMDDDGGCPWRIRLFTHDYSNSWGSSITTKLHIDLELPLVTKSICAWYGGIWDPTGGCKMNVGHSMEDDVHDFQVDVMIASTQHTHVRCYVVCTLAVCLWVR